MADVETRELRYFLAVARELHFGRAADALGMSQPPLSRAIRQLERRLGVQLFDRDRHGVALTDAGRVLLVEAGRALDAVDTAVARTRRAASDAPLVLVSKAGAAVDLLQRLVAQAREDAAVGAVQVVLCEVGEQAGLLRTGQADVALMHRPVDDLAGFGTLDLHEEGQVALLPAGHPLATRAELSMAEVTAIPDLPMARWPGLDGTYPEGPGPEIRTQAQLAQQVAMGLAVLVIPRSSRAWQWPQHVAVPVLDAPLITSVLAWPTGSRSNRVAALVRMAQAHLGRDQVA